MVQTSTELGIYLLDRPWSFVLVKVHKNTYFLFRNKFMISTAS
jgi:hypothetical protein